MQDGAMQSDHASSSVPLFIKASSLSNLRDHQEALISPPKPLGAVHPVPLSSNSSNPSNDQLRPATEPFIRRHTVIGTTTSATSPRKPIGPLELVASIKQNRFFDAMTLYQEQQQDLALLQSYSDGHGKSLLHHACRAAQVQIIKWLLFHGHDPVRTCQLQRTAFHDAISSASNDGKTLEMLQLLYAHAPHGIAMVDTNGTHLVHLAAIHGRVDVLEWIMETLSAIKTFTMAMTSFSGRNILHYAAYNGRLKVLQWILNGMNEVEQEHEHDVSFGDLSLASLDANGYSVLHYAALGGHLDVCQWIVLHATQYGDPLSMTARNRDGQTAMDLAKSADVKEFLHQVSQPPSAPIDVRCVGADGCSLGVSWTIEEPANVLVRQVLAPIGFELEYCKKPTALSRASGLLTMMMMMPSSGATMSILKWEKIDVMLQPEASEYWLCGLEPATEYLVRMRAINRNGYSGYSTPNLSGEFATTAMGVHVRPTSSDSPSKTSEVGSAFIGTLHLEVLEARHLNVIGVASTRPRALSPSSLARPRRTSSSSSTTSPTTSPTASGTRRRRASTVVQGKFYCVVSLELPIRNQRRRHTFPAGKTTPISMAEDHEKDAKPRKRKFMYVVRSSYATLQDELVIAGSPNASSHPQFQFSTKFRVPEVPGTVLHIALHHESARRQDSVIGTLELALMDFVRGLPAKLQWQSLQTTTSASEVMKKQDATMRIGTFQGEVLIRSLFLADGIRFLPHPTRPNVFCTTAEGLLSPYGPKAVEDDPAQDLADALGFRIDRPVPSKQSTTDANRLKKPAKKMYEYYRLLYECLETQQLEKFAAFHDQFHPKPLLQAHEQDEQDEFSLAQVLEATCSGRKVDGDCPYVRRTSPLLRQLVWHGIPTSVRPFFYLRMSGALTKQQHHSTKDSSYYDQLLQQATDWSTESAPDQEKEAQRRFKSAKKQIQVDLQRTFAGNHCWTQSPRGQLALERVLTAYAVHNQSLGYCQSMSLITSKLLCLFHQYHHHDDEKNEACVFWLLCVLCEHFFPEYYTQGMRGVHVDGLVLEKLIQKRLPKLFRHFQQLQTPHIGVLLVSQWCLPVFCAVFPSETSFRLLDVLWFEGSAVVFALCLALLRLTQQALLQHSSDYMQLFRVLKERDAVLFDTVLLMEVAYEEFVMLLHEENMDTLRTEARNHPSSPTAAASQDRRATTTSVVSPTASSERRKRMST